MIIDTSCQKFQIIDATNLQIRSGDGHNLATVRIDPSFFQEHLPVPAEGPGPDLAAEDWSKINVKG